MSDDAGAGAGTGPGAAPAARRRAVAVAGHRGDADAARAGTTDPDPRVRASALGALARVGSLRGDDLAVALGDPDRGVRRRAVELAATQPGDQAPALVPVLAGAEDELVEVAAWASGERVPPEPGAVEALVAVATSHDDPLCREAAVAALGAIGDPAGLAAVLTACRDRATVRRRAVLALAAFDDPRAEAALRTFRDDRDRQVRQAAEELGP